VADFQHNHAQTRRKGAQVEGLHVGRRSNQPARPSLEFSPRLTVDVDVNTLPSDAVTVRRLTRQLLSLLSMLAVLAGAPTTTLHVAAGPQDSSPTEERSEGEDAQAEAPLKFVRFAESSRKLVPGGVVRPAPEPSSNTFSVRHFLSSPDVSWHPSFTARVLLPRRAALEGDDGGDALV
jgi:hypothetical protein